MKTIYKYDCGSNIQLSLPPDAKVLAFGNQYEQPTMWVELDTEVVKIVRRFVYVSTGGIVPENATHLGTALFQNGDSVLHLYEIH